MSFLRVKKRVKFNVEMVVTSLADVPLLNAVIFAKVRLMECGSFESFTWHRPVFSHKVDFMEKSATSNSSSSTADELDCASIATVAGDMTAAEVGGASDAPQNGMTAGGDENPQPFHFQCRIPFDERTGELEQCRCKVSLRKEDRGGRAPQKLGFVVLNLSEFAASGSTGIQQSFLLDGYTGQRQDNSRVNVRVKMVHQAQDPLFKVPKTTMNATDEAQLNPADRKAPSSDFSANVVAAAGISLDEQNSDNHNSAEVTARSGGTQRLDLHHHFLSYQPNHHHYHHHYEDRPISCTNFASTSANTNAVLAEGVGAPDQRASWHGGGNFAHNYGNCNGITMTGVGQENASTTKMSSSEAAAGDGLAETLHNKFGRRESEENHLVDLSSPYVPPPTSMAFSTTSSMGGGSLANRIQKTRRDASGVIEEVLAETSALLAVEPRVVAARLSWEGIGSGDGSYGEEGLSEEYNDDNEENIGNDIRRHHHRHHHHLPHFLLPHHFGSRISNRIGLGNDGVMASEDNIVVSADNVGVSAINSHQTDPQNMALRIATNGGNGNNNNNVDSMPFITIDTKTTSRLCNNNNGGVGKDIQGGGTGAKLCGDTAKSSADFAPLQPPVATSRPGILAQEESRAIAGAKS